MSLAKLNKQFLQKYFVVSIFSHHCQIYKNKCRGRSRIYLCNEFFFEMKRALLTDVGGDICLTWLVINTFQSFNNFSSELKNRGRCKLNLSRNTKGEYTVDVCLPIKDDRMDYLPKTTSNVSKILTESIEPNHVFLSDGSTYPVYHYLFGISKYDADTILTNKREKIIMIMMTLLFFILFTLSWVAFTKSLVD